jgi:hypothetical protein
VTTAVASIVPADAEPEICSFEIGDVVFTPTAPVEPVAKILMLPAPSEMKMLLF